MGKNKKQSIFSLAMSAAVVVFVGNVALATPPTFDSCCQAWGIMFGNDDSIPYVVAVVADSDDVQNNPITKFKLLLMACRDL